MYGTRQIGTRTIGTLLLVSVLALVGCSGSGETPEQKLEGFRAAHYAIYDAWAAETPQELRERLEKGMIDPFLSEQIKQQTGVMQQRKLLNEKHTVDKVTFNELKLVKDGDEEITVYADWTVTGWLDHGHKHEVKVSYKKHFHSVKQNGRWIIDTMTD